MINDIPYDFFSFSRFTEKFVKSFLTFKNFVLHPPSLITHSLQIIIYCQGGGEGGTIENVIMSILHSLKSSQMLTSH